MDELVKRLKIAAEWADKGLRIPPSLCLEPADAIEKLHSQVESLCETVDLYQKLLSGHQDPRGEDGEPGIKCLDCQTDCQMIGLDMPACTAYVPPKEET